MALWAFRFFAQATGDYELALARFEEARRVSEQTGGDRELAYALCGLGLVRLRLGQTAASGPPHRTIPPYRPAGRWHRIRRRAGSAR